MKVLLNEQGYVESYALEGDLLDAVETEEPDDLSHFEEHFTAYQVRDGILAFDDAQAAAEQAEAVKGRIPKAAGSRVLSRHQPGAALVRYPLGGTALGTKNLVPGMAEWYQHTNHPGKTGMADMRTKALPLGASFPYSKQRRTRL